MQQTNSSFAKKLGARVAQANAEHKDKPIDTGMKRLPAGIKSGIAKLQFMYTKEQDKEDGKIPKGENFFRASAVSLGKLVNGHIVKEHEGENIENITTSLVIPLCDISAKGMSKGKTFSENWFEFQNLFKLLSNGSIVCNETAQTDPTGQKTEAFYFAAMQALTNPKHPVYIDFSTRGWTPPASAQQPKPEEMVFETWHGLAQLPAGALKPHDPAAGVTQAPNRSSHPSDPPPQTQMAPSQSPASPSTNGPPLQQQPSGDGDGGQESDEDYVAGLVEAAMDDPECKTPDGAAATSQLEQMAWARGWTREQTGAAKDWSEVGGMALTDPDKSAPSTAPTAPPQNAVGTIVVGGKWMYAKRTKEGVKYKDNKGVEFAAQECEVTSVNAEAKTCTLKTVHDGKDVVDLRTKKPVDVKFEWLENAPPY